MQLDCGFELEEVAAGQLGVGDGFGGDPFVRVDPGVSLDLGRERAGAAIVGVGEECLGVIGFSISFLRVTEEGQGGALDVKGGRKTWSSDAQRIAGGGVNKACVQRNRHASYLERKLRGVAALGSHAVDRRLFAPAVLWHDGARDDVLLEEYEGPHATCDWTFRTEVTSSQQLHFRTLRGRCRVT